MQCRHCLEVEAAPGSRFCKACWELTTECVVRGCHSPKDINSKLCSDCSSKYERAGQAIPFAQWLVREEEAPPSPQQPKTALLPTTPHDFSERQRVVIHGGFCEMMKLEQEERGAVLELLCRIFGVSLPAPSMSTLKSLLSVQLQTEKKGENAPPASVPAPSKKKAPEKFAPPQSPQPEALPKKTSNKTGVESSPSFLRWQKNFRGTQIAIFSFEGQEVTATEIAKRFTLSYGMLKERLARGHSMESAVNVRRKRL